jgi:thiol-disulfide isomerase/thioredoxin
VKRDTTFLVFTAVVVALLLFIGFRAARHPGARGAAGSGSASLGPNGKPAPDFTLDSLDGKSITLSGYHGQAVLLNFWATWCGPCKIEMPWFVELQKQYGPDGLQIVGVAMDDASKEDIDKFVKEMGVNYPILIGKESVGEQYGGVNVLPTTFFIDRDGKIVAREFGLQSRSVFVDHIKQALSQGRTVQAQK